jgi:hypothetical protein
MEFLLRNPRPRDNRSHHYPSINNKIQSTKGVDGKESDIPEYDTVNSLIRSNGTDNVAKVQASAHQTVAILIIPNRLMPLARLRPIGSLANVNALTGSSNLCANRFTVLKRKNWNGDVEVIPVGGYDELGVG